MKHLAEHAHAGAATRTPMRAARSLLALAGKPAARRRPPARRAPPRARRRTTARSVGAMLARMHLRRRATSRRAQPNLRGLAWWSETVPVVVPHLDAAQARADAGRARLPAATSPRRRPTRRCRAAPIHADLFRDNVMFVERRRSTGVFDFYFAGVDTLLFDIAVCLNDWCIDLDSGRLDEDRAQRLRRRLRARAPARDRRACA